jgi:hypothetical protein
LTPAERCSARGAGSGLVAGGDEVLMAGASEIVRRTLPVVKSITVVVGVSLFARTGYQAHQQAAGDGMTSAESVTDLLQGDLRAQLAEE